MIVRLTLTIVSVLIGLFGYTQCPPGPLGTGNFLDKPAGCATFGLDIEFTPLYSQLDDNAQIVIDWGDGTPNETINTGTTGAQTGVTYNTPVPHTYTEANTTGQCVYEITAYVISGCYTQEETTVTAQIVIWNTDNFPDLEPDPLIFEVCAGTSSTVTIEDMSPWNCTDPAETTSLNQNTRWTQWIYGDDNTITGTVLIDGNAEAYPFDGTIYEHPGPILAPQAPGNQSLEVFIPASANIGEEFSIELNNWNQCNPYEDLGGVPTGNNSVARKAFIRVIGPPVPEFEPREGDASGIAPVPPIFCIQEDIYFANQTAGAGGPYEYEWQFYDGPNDTSPLATTLGYDNPSTDENPTYQYTSGGNKLVRLIATDPDADGACDIIYEETIILSPDAVADFDFYDAGFTTMIDPTFCKTGSQTFTVGFQDNTTLVPNTELRFEFYREGNSPDLGIPDFTEPNDGSFLASNIPPFTETFSAEEYVIVRLVARNAATNCSNNSQDTIFVYGQPVPAFTTNEACEGSRTTFNSIADITSLTSRVNDDVIETWEWDFSYDGTTFNSELIQTDNTDFDWFLDGTDIATGIEPATSVSGNYTVALRMVTEKGGCDSLIQQTVVINPNPDAQLAYEPATDICPSDIITFINNSNNPATPVTYTLAITHPPSGFSLSTPIANINNPLSFDNPDDTTRTFSAQITAESDNGCITMSNVETFRVSPGEGASFSDPAYDFFNTNCSPWVSTMIVDQETIALNADTYIWTLIDQNGALDGYPITTLNTNPNFNQLNYTITNTSATIANYRMILEAQKTGVCISNDTFNIQISPQPDATFSLVREDDCEQVIFTLEATQKGLTDYAWSFNPTPDAINDEGDEIQISFNRGLNSENDFDAILTLTTTNLASCTSDPEIVIETIEKQRQDINADFTADPTELQLPDNTVTITNNSSTGPGFTYLWDFGDGNTSTDQDPGTHQYNRFGTYQITLMVTDAFCTVETSQTITVFPAAPVLDFEADMLEGCAPLTVQFTNLSQFAVPGKYLWEFGDGSISRADNPTHTFFQSGSFAVRLRGENEVGETSEIGKEDYIEVYARPFADFLVSARVVYIPDQEALFNNLSQNATSYFWDFGDGFTSIDENPKHAYAEEGFYDITLIATNDFGCVDTLFRAAEVEAISGGQVNTPNAFTPSLNGPTGGVVNPGNENPSEINDVFLPRVEGVERFKMFIYNKWGELVFESRSQNQGWDGYYKNNLAPSGVYVYKLELRFSDGQDVIKVGDVTLIR